MNNKRALMVWGGWRGHEPQQCVERFAPALREAGFEVEVSDTLDAYLDKERMGSLSLVVPCWTMDAISKEQLDGLLSAVREGVGIAGWHGGMGDSFRQATEYQFMVGGQWVAHPGNIIDYRVHIADRARTRSWPGLDDFAHALGTILSAHRPFEPGASHHDVQRRTRPVDRGHRDARRLEAALWLGTRVLFLARSRRE